MVTVPLVSKKRQRAAALQKFQHLIPAVPLMTAGPERGMDLADLENPAPIRSALVDARARLS